MSRLPANEKVKCIGHSTIGCSLFWEFLNNLQTPVIVDVIFRKCKKAWIEVNFIFSVPKNGFYRGAIGQQTNYSFFDVSWFFNVIMGVLGGFNYSQMAD